MRIFKHKAEYCYTLIKIAKFFKKIKMNKYWHGCEAIENLLLGM